MKRTFLMVLCVLASLAVGQALQAETSSAVPVPENGACALNSADIAALVGGAGLSPVQPMQPAAQPDPFGGGPQTNACCSLAERNECYALYGGCAHWYCDLVCICENIC
jgi:hypothetical protein